MDKPSTKFYANCFCKDFRNTTKRNNAIGRINKQDVLTKSFKKNHNINDVLLSNGDIADAINNAHTSSKPVVHLNGKSRQLITKQQKQKLASTKKTHLIESKEQVNDMNLKITMFMNELTGFKRNVNIADGRTLTLLTELRDNVNVFFKGISFTPMDNNFEINDRDTINYQIIMSCKVCHKQVGKSQLNYLTHIESAEHKRNVASSILVKEEKENLIKKPINALIVDFDKADRIVNTKRNINDRNVVHIAASKSNKYYRSILKAKNVVLPKTNTLNTSTFNVVLVQNMIIATHQMFEKYQRDGKYLKKSKKGFVVLKQLSQQIYNSSLYTCVNVHIFGLRTVGMGCLNEVFDICIDIGKVDCANDKERQRLISAIYHINTFLINDTGNWKNVRLDIFVRTPVIRAYCPKLGAECRISLNNELELHNTKLIDHFVKLQPMLRQLVLFLKQWIRRSTLNDKINSYTLTLLVIFFLQTIKRLPTIIDIQKASTPTIVKGWRVDIRKNAAPKMQKYSDYILPLVKFFKFYAKFDFNSKAVCIFLGLDLQRSLFDNNDQLPPELSRLRDYTTRVMEQLHTNYELFDYKSPMCVMDLFDLSNNVCSNVEVQSVQEFTKLCKLASQMFA